MFDLIGIKFLEEQPVLHTIPSEISFMIGILSIFIGIVILWNVYKYKERSFKKFKIYGE